MKRTYLKPEVDIKTYEAGAFLVCASIKNGDEDKQHPTDTDDWGFDPGAKDRFYSDNWDEE